MSLPQIPRCPCCGYRTGCTTCPICFWTDDGRGDQEAAAVMTDGPNGELSLSEARLSFHLYGACHHRYADLVRAPRRDELP